MAQQEGTSSEPHSDPASCHSLSGSHEINSRGISLFDEPTRRQGKSKPPCVQSGERTIDKVSSLQSHYDTDLIRDEMCAVVDGVHEFSP